MKSRLVPARHGREEKQLPAVPKKKRISKLKLEGLKSIVGDSAEDMQQLLEAQENDSAITLIHRRLLQSLIDVIPHAEHNIRKTKGARGVYQMNSLISSVRELIIDIQSTQDRGQLGVNLVDKIVRPVFMDLAMELVKEYDGLRSDAQGSMSAEDYKAFRSRLQESRGRVAEFVQTRFMNMRDEAIQFLQK